MALDLTSFAAALKEHYKDERIKDLVYKSNPLLAMIPKFEEFDGELMQIPVKFGNPQGRSSTFQTAQANKGNTQLVAFNIRRKRDYSLASIDSETMDASMTNRGAFIRAATLEIDSSIDALKRSMAVDLYGNGSGARGVDDTSVTATTFTLTNVDDVTNFEVDMQLVAAANDTTAPRAGSMAVTAVNRDTGVITVASTAAANMVSGDTVFSQGDYLTASGRLKLFGLDAWVPATGVIAPGDNFNGVDRTVDPTRLGGQRVDGTGLPIEEALIRGATRVAREGGVPDVCFMSFTNYENLINALGAKVEYDNITPVDAQIGFEGVKIHGPRGPIMVIPDHNAQQDLAWMLQMDTWSLNSLGMAPKILGHDGNRMLREANADAVEVRIGYYGELACAAPGWNCRITLS